MSELYIECCDWLSVLVISFTDAFGVCSYQRRHCLHLPFFPDVSVCLQDTHTQPRWDIALLHLYNCFTFYGASICWSCCVSCSSGKVVSGYRVRNGQWTQIGRQSPLLPQVCLNVSTVPDQAWLIHGIYRGSLMHHLSLIRVVSHVNDPSVCYVLPAVRPLSTLSMLFTKVSVSAISSDHNIQCIHVECTHIRSVHY